MGKTHTDKVREKRGEEMNKNINKSLTSISFHTVSYINAMAPLPIQSPIGNLKESGAK